MVANQTAERQKIGWKMTFLVIVVAILLLGLGVVVNDRFTLQSPGGNDFLVHWVGARAFLIGGISPYDESVALEIQTRAYGRPARPGEHELRVAYPFYSVLIFAPFALIEEYTLARALWMTALEAGLLGLVLVSLKLTGWRLKPLGLGSLLLYTFFWYHSIRPLINGNVVILIALFLSLALLAIKLEKDELAAILLAVVTIKPQLALLPVMLVLLWAFSQRRICLIAWFFSTLTVLVLGGMLFLPQWPAQNLAEILRYPGYNPPGTPGSAFAAFWPGWGRWLGVALSIFLTLLLFYEWRAAWKKPFAWLLWTACLTLVVSQWIGIQTDPGNFIILYPALALLLAKLSTRYGKAGAWLSSSLALALLIGLWALFLATVQYGDQPQQHPIMFFPLPFILLLGLYGIKKQVLAGEKTEPLEPA